MSDFKVDTESVGRLAQLFERMHDDAKLAPKYVDQNSELEGGEGWLNAISGSHAEVISSTSHWLQRLEGVTADTESAISSTNAAYKSQDEENSEALDQELDEYQIEKRPAGPGTNLYEQHPDKKVFDDLVNPGNNYKDIQDYNKEVWYQFHPKFTDWLTPASAARSTINEATEFLAWAGLLDRAYDPYEEFTKPIVGDWAAIRGCSDMFRNLADAVGEMSTNCLAAHRNLPDVWMGNAAGAAQFHIDQLHTGLIECQPAFLAMSDEYLNAAQGAKEFRSVADTCLNNIFDAAIILIGAIAVGGGGAKFTAGVSAVLGTIVGSVEAYLIVDAVTVLLNYISTMDELISVFKTAAAGFGEIDASCNSLPALPPEVSEGQHVLDNLPE